jgi:hypothetical protein
MLPTRPRYVSFPNRICSPTARSFSRAPSCALLLANARVQRAGPPCGPEPLERVVRRPIASRPQTCDTITVAAARHLRATPHQLHCKNRRFSAPQVSDCTAGGSLQG